MYAQDKISDNEKKKNLFNSNNLLFPYFIKASAGILFSLCNSTKTAPARLKSQFVSSRHLKKLKLKSLIINRNFK